MKVALGLIYIYGAKTQKILRGFRLSIILFIYVFAFFLGPLTTSLILGAGLWIFSLFNGKFRDKCFEVIKTKLIYKLFRCWILIIFLGLAFCIIYFTFDYSFLSIYIAQLFHFVAAIPVFAYLSYKRYSIKEVEKSFIDIFIVQTFIQLIVASIPSLRTAMFAFNHFDPTSVVGMGDNIRGSALAAATTYHLSLAYGVCFIIYVKHYLLYKIDCKVVLYGILIFAGIFCAGRSGFVGCCIALLGYFILSKDYRRISRLKAILKIGMITLMLVFILLVILSVLAPTFFEMLNTYILPYAFEFLYNLQDGGNVETASTNRLIEMWNENFNYIELLIGSGHFSNMDGSYYMHVDPGILRHLLYFGILGYILILYYQYLAIPFMRMKRKEKYFSFLICIFVFVMDFKGLTVGGNKFMIFIPLLLSYTYLYLQSSQDN